MKEIKAIIRPFKLLHVVSALQKIENLPGVTISDIRGFGKSKAKDAREKIMDGLIAYVQKVKIEVVVPDELVETVVSTIQAQAQPEILAMARYSFIPWMTSSRSGRMKGGAEPCSLLK